jgi:hypothetical protein
MATKVQRIKAPAAMLQLHIELRGTKPKVWRRVLVPETITPIKLHLVIQAIFGWGHSHLHEFIANDGERYGTSDPMYDSPGDMTSEKVRLTTALRTTKTLNYVYDFGDYWEHRIKVEDLRARRADQVAILRRWGRSNASRGLRWGVGLRGLRASED